MNMKRIRQGNDFLVTWRIKRAGINEDLTQAVNMSLVASVKSDGLIHSKIVPFDIVDNSIVRIEVTPQIAQWVGIYNFVLKYEFDYPSYADNNEKVAVDKNMFIIVSRTAQADEITIIECESDVLIGLKGEKGDSAFTVWNKENGGNNTYDDWIDFLQAPATQIEGIVSANEAVRIENENQRVIDEGKREQLYDNTVILKGEVETLKTETETAKDSAISAATLANDKANLANVAAQSATDATIEAQTATQEATTAASLADRARLAIQDDLVLKANQTDLEQLESEVSVKLNNLITNGNFVDGTTGWRFGNSITETSVADGILSFIGGGGLGYHSANWISRANRTMFTGGHILYNIVTARSLMGARFYVGFGYGYSTFDLTDQWGTYSYLGGHTSSHGPTYGAFSGDTAEMTNAMCFDLTEIFGAGGEPTKEEMDLLISTLGIDYFEGEITIPAQKVMQWQLRMIRQNRSAIIALGGTIA